jgi:hypothetical protein
VIELRQIKREMLLAHVMEGSEDTALEERKTALGSISRYVTSSVFINVVVDRFMGFQALGCFQIDLKGISHDARILLDIRFEDRLQILPSDRRNDDGASTPPRSTRETTAVLLPL